MFDPPYASTCLYVFLIPIMDDVFLRSSVILWFPWHLATIGRYWTSLSGYMAVLCADQINAYYVCLAEINSSGA
jgi:hypothetical protein